MFTWPWASQFFAAWAPRRRSSHDRIRLQSPASPLICPLIWFDGESSSHRGRRTSSWACCVPLSMSSSRRYSKEEGKLVSQRTLSNRLMWSGAPLRGSQRTPFISPLARVPETSSQLRCARGAEQSNHQESGTRATAANARKKRAAIRASNDSRAFFIFTEAMRSPLLALVARGGSLGFWREQQRDGSLMVDQEGVVDALFAEKGEAGDHAVG